jgi:hypothetical protein
MRTDDLIVALARHAEAVDPRLSVRRLLAASITGVAAALPIMWWRFGLNPGLAADTQTPMFWLKAVFVVALVVAGSLLVNRLARPGQAWRRAARAVAWPVIALWALAAVVMIVAAPVDREALVMGSSWNSCPINIALLSLPAFVLLFAVVRTLAPTRPTLAGAATGLLAGALGTLAYLLHCPELEAPFVAVWYVLGMAIPAAIGGLIGPAVLRW